MRRVWVWLGLFCFAVGLSVYGLIPKTITIAPLPFNINGEGQVVVTLTVEITREDVLSQSFDVSLLDIDEQRNDLLGKTTITPPIGDYFAEGQERTFVIPFNVTCDRNLVMRGTESSSESEADLAVQVGSGEQKTTTIYYDTASNGQGVSIRCVRLAPLQILSGASISPKMRPLAPRFQMPSSQITATEQGDFGVVWLNEPSTCCYNSIELKLIKRDGRDMTGSVRVDQGDGHVFYSPDIAYSNRRFLVVWRDDRSDPHVFVRIFDEAGQPQSEEIRISNAPIYGIPSVATIGMGKFLVTWADSTGIYARFVNDQGKLTEEFVVNASKGVSPHVAADADGDFIAAWAQLDGFQTTGVFARAFNLEGSPQGQAFRVDSFNGQNDIQNAKIAFNQGRYLIAWQEDRDGNGAAEIWGRLLDTGGSLTVNDFRINEVVTHPPLIGTKDLDLAAVGDKFIAVWTDQRSGKTDLFGAFVGLNGPASDDFQLTLNGGISQSRFSNYLPAVTSVTLPNGATVFATAWTQQDTSHEYSIQFNVLCSLGLCP